MSGAALALAALLAAPQESAPTRFVPPPPARSSTGEPRPAAGWSPQSPAPRLRGRPIDTKATLHPDAPQLRGLEDGEPTSRADLPLARTALGGAPLDGDELHARQLAIVAGGRAAALPDPPALADAIERTRAARRVELRAETSRMGAIPGAVAVVLLLLAWLFVRRARRDEAGRAAST